MEGDRADIQLDDLTVVAIATIALSSGALAERTALDDYVSAPDSELRFTRFETKRELLYTTHCLELTSQQWRAESEVTPSVWRHELVIYVPRGVRLSRKGAAIMAVTGGDNDDPDFPSCDVDSDLGVAAFGTQVPIVDLGQVPNQPLTMPAVPDAPPDLKEDEILATSLHWFLEGCNASSCEDERLVHLAMARAVVRAMDASQRFLANRAIPVERFVVAGASKRGWATWLAAAAEAEGRQRVQAIAPIVFDALNLQIQTNHHWATAMDDGPPEAGANGEYSAALFDYTRLPLAEETNVFCDAKFTEAGEDNPAGNRAYAIIDPFAYRERLTIPKRLANSTGDEFFPPDSSQRYFDSLVGENWLRYVPNSEHGLDEQRRSVLAETIAWADDIIDGDTPPNIEWSVDEDVLTVSTDAPVAAATLWQAWTPENAERDFRKASDVVWERTAELGTSGTYEVQLGAMGTEQWMGSTVEVTFDTSGVRPARVVTTPVFVRPDRFPRPPNQHCQPK